MAERELRIAARRMRTYQIRRWMVLVPWIFIVFTQFGLPLVQFPPWNGRELFQSMVWFAYAFCLVSGVAATADCISQEKREGTLGLLFLTELKGHDVMLGKLTASSLHCFYGLVATFPVLALPMLMGGTHWAEFWRIVLALTLTLLLSISAGLLISSLSRNSSRLLFLALGALCYGGGLSELTNLLPSRTPWPRLAEILHLADTRYLLEMAFHENWMRKTNHFWTAAAALGVISLLSLAMVCWLLPRAWQEKRALNKGRWRHWKNAWKFGTGDIRRQWRTHWLNKNPISWLTIRNRSAGFGFLGLFLVIGLAAVYAGQFDLLGARVPKLASILAAGFFGVCALHLLILAAIPTFAGWRLDPVQSWNVLEMICLTPLTEREILSGHWRALRRRMLVPLLVTIFMTAVVVGAIVRGISLEIPNYHFLSALGDGVYHFWVGDGSDIAMLFAIACAVLPTFWLALGLAGMWTGLIVRKPAYAPILAWIIVFGLPWVILSTIYALGGLLHYLDGYSNSIEQIRPEFLWTVVTLLYNFSLIFLLRFLLIKQFRRLVIRRSVPEKRNGKTQGSILLRYFAFRTLKESSLKTDNSPA